MSKRAVILAGGLGTRLRPYTIALPKPLMPVGAFPILEVIIKQLSEQGFDHITLAVNHQAEIIKAYFSNGEKWDVRIDYSLEKIPLGTIGPLTLMRDLPENFLLMNGDILTDLDFGDFFDAHVAETNLFTISSIKRGQKIDFGVIEKSQDQLEKLTEKPTLEYEVSMGVYMLNREALNFIPKETYFGFDNMMEILLAKSKSISVKTFNGYWLDIGRPDDYEQAIDIFSSEPSKFVRG